MVQFIEDYIFSHWNWTWIETWKSWACKNLSEICLVSSKLCKCILGNLKALSSDWAQNWPKTAITSWHGAPLTQVLINSPPPRGVNVNLSTSPDSQSIERLARTINKRFVRRPHISVSHYFSSQLFVFVTLTEYFQID